jgi:DHA2 family multidrug resistance protein
MSAATSAEAPANRTMITVSVMLATVMTAIDTTIANVALPHMAGSVSASADQITWVLTSYIVAMAIMTPMSGWLAGRFGRKRVFLVSIVGFTAASALCGAAQSLEQIVLFRVLQGALGAAMVPLSQAVILDAYPIEERGPAMAVWGMGMIVAPIAGPVLGGWLTDDFSWRWVFYINLPVGALAVLGVLAFIPDARSERRLRFDVAGFALLSIVLVALQLLLDRGQNNDWFQSPEIVIEAGVGGVALILFVIHSMTAEHPFMPLALLGDRNLVASTILGLAVGVVLFAAMALLPPMTQNLLGYPVVTAGVVMAPRGVGALISTYFAGRLVGRVDNRLLIVVGLGMFAAAFEAMSHFSLQMSSDAIATTGFVQGLGGGLVFVPMSTLAFATLDPALRADGAGFSTLIRNLGNSGGISIMQAMFTRNVQVVHNRLVEGLTPDNPLARPPYLSAPYTLSDPAGLAALNGEVTRQASMVAYVDVFHLLFLTTLVTAPLVLFLRKPGRG